MLRAGFFALGLVGALAAAPSPAHAALVSQPCSATTDGWVTVISGGPVFAADLAGPGEATGNVTITCLFANEHANFEYQSLTNSGFAVLEPQVTMIEDPSGPPMICTIANINERSFGYDDAHGWSETYRGCGGYGTFLPNQNTISDTTNYAICTLFPNDLIVANITVWDC